MSAPAADVSETVTYSMDKWLIDRIPWALWSCAAGLAVVLNADGRGIHGAVLAFVDLALLGVAFAGYAATILIKRSGISFIVELPIHVLIFVGVAIIIGIVAAIFGGSLGSTAGVRGSLRWSMLVDPPTSAYGWMLIDLGIGWIAFATYRHFHPARPLLTLTPAGVSFHRSWLPELFIPWQDIHGVGPTGYLATSSRAITVLVTQEFYEQHIAPKRRFFAPPGSEYMFRPDGDMMQMVLNSTEATVDPADYRIPIEMRWKAFRDQPRRAPPPADPTATGIVYGRWSFNGSWRQVIQFSAPLVVMVAIALHARNFG